MGKFCIIVLNSSFYEKFFLLLTILITLYANLSIAQQPGYVLVIHGGAGNITPVKITPDKQILYEQKLREALTAGEKVLANGGSALDAVVAAVQLMEECPLLANIKIKDATEVWQPNMTH